MSIHGPSDLPSDVADLLASERAVPPAPPGARANVLARVHTAIAAGAVVGGSSAAAAAGGFVWKAITVAIVVSAATGGAVYAVHSRASSPSRSHTSVAAHSSVAPTNAIVQGRTTSPATNAPALGDPHAIAAPIAPTPSTVAVEPAPVAHHDAAPSAEPARDEDLHLENELIDAARSAIAVGRADEALSVLSRHARSFPSGRLSEERDVLRIQALSSAGRDDEARTEASRFRRQHPSSVFLPVIDQAVGATH